MNFVPYDNFIHTFLRVSPINTFQGKAIILILLERMIGIFLWASFRNQRVRTYPYHDIHCCFAFRKSNQHETNQPSLYSPHYNLNKYESSFFALDIMLWTMSLTHSINSRHPSTSKCDIISTAGHKQTIHFLTYAFVCITMAVPVFISASLYRSCL